MNTYKPIGIYRDNQPIRCLSYNHKGDAIAIGTNGKEIKILQNISEIPEKFDGLGNLPVMKLLYTKYYINIIIFNIDITNQMFIKDQYMELYGIQLKIT